MDIFSEHTDPTRDRPRLRSIEVPNGSPFLLEQFNPNGFWRIRREHGQVPESLQGQYTTYDKAEQAVQSYIVNMRTPKKQ